ncbi:MAG: calcium-binding protein [Planctomycetota bacterium]|nr:calcium-binding protein [Planctomycetota bacterium]
MKNLPCLLTVLLSWLPTTVDAQTWQYSRSETVESTVRELRIDGETLLRMQSGSGDLTWGEVPNDLMWNARIHELVNSRGRVLRRYLHVEGTSEGEGLQVRALRDPVTGREFLVAELDENGDAVADQVIEFPEFEVSAIDDIRIFGLGGNDRIRNLTSVPDFLFGGLGEDTLIGGEGPSGLFGQQGDDNVFGEGGNDLVFGEEGNDNLGGGAGQDVVVGGPGNDLVSGNWDFDWNGHASFDDGFPDMLTGGSGNDIFWVSSDEDQVTEFGLGDDSFGMLESPDELFPGWMAGLELMPNDWLGWQDGILERGSFQVPVPTQAGNRMETVQFGWRTIDMSYAGSELNESAWIGEGSFRSGVATGERLPMKRDPAAGSR